MFSVEAIRDHFLFFPQCSFNSYSLHPLDFRYHHKPSLPFTFIPDIFSCDSTTRAHCPLLSFSHCFSLQITASVIPSFDFIIKLLLAPIYFMYLLAWTILLVLIISWRRSARIPYIFAIFFSPYLHLSFVISQTWMKSFTFFSHCIRVQGWQRNITIRSRGFFNPFCRQEGSEEVSSHGILSISLREEIWHKNMIHLNRH